MRAPRGGWLRATVASLALLAPLALLPGAGSLDSAAIDLRHRWIALVAPTQTLRAGGEPTPRQVPLLGVNTFLEQEVEGEKRRRSLDLLREAGVGWIRQQVPWETIEPVQKGAYVDPNVGGSTWTKFDAIVDEARARGMDLILRLDTAPGWARPPGAASGVGPPLRYEDYWDFVETVATRYRGRVRAYQVWNEPNLHIEWGRQPPDPAAYARLLAGAAERIRRADPAALVLAAAMAPTLTESAEALNELVFLQRLYDAGARASFDVLAVQAYGLRGGPDDPRTGPADVTFSRPRLVRDLMVRNGDAEKPIWATEVGWNVNPPDFVEQKFGRVTPTLQARYTVRALERVRQQWPWLEVVCLWYWKRADDRERGQDWYWFRLADPDFQLQPVYYALRDEAAARWPTSARDRAARLGSRP